MGKKRKNQDFQKVKFKVGRKLPKGTNVTDTSFKARKIAVPFQIKLTNTEEPKTHRKLTVKDLLSRLQHYSPSTRHESLMGLKDLLTQNSELIDSNLASLVEQLSELTTDKDVAVRKAVLKVLNIIFGHIKSEQIIPFFPILTSYLCCALTHIISDIRHDSLSLLDLLLEKFPDLVCSYSDRLMPNFMEQISTKKTVSLGSTSNFTETRILAVSPGDKITSQVWRVKVLTRVANFLKAALTSFQKQDLMNPHEGELEVHWDRFRPTEISVFQHSAHEPQLAVKYSLSNQHKVAVNDIGCLKNAEFVQNFITVLMPLLVETWIEASPQATTDSPGSVLSPEAAETLQCVLCVMELLGELVSVLSTETEALNMDWFRENFRKDFLQHFFRWFPYSQHHRFVKKKKQKNLISKVPSTRLNLTICSLFTLLVPKLGESLGSLHKRITKYLIKLIEKEELEPGVDIELLLKVIRNLLIANNVIDDRLMNALLDFYRVLQPEQKDYRVLLDFFMELALDPQFYYMKDNSSLASWLQFFPYEIIQKFPANLAILVTAARKLASRGVPDFLLGLQDCEVQIIEMIRDLPDGPEHLVIQRHLVELVCKIPQLSLNSFHLLSEISSHKLICVKNLLYLIQILNQRFLRNEPGFPGGEFVSLLLSSAIGVLKQGQNKLCKEWREKIDLLILANLSCFCLVPSKQDDLYRQMEITRGVCSVIREWPDNLNVKKIFNTYLKQFFEIFRYLPVHSASAVLWLATELSSTNKEKELDKDLSWDLVQLSLATLAILLRYERDRSVNEDFDENYHSLVLNITTRYLKSCSSTTLLYDSLNQCTTSKLRISTQFHNVVLCML
ncbi:testis-expressed protein 10 homolog [Limulus polyphemus]|uniref:Testis-expressed protein 10 homolog n=1 Tax=Limulus polyphemus TaxID=6850 RepID=A0ABM1BJN9_LIMPO|nr:testis-expressed protein 10 homolog [Limulus polyphemus]